MIELAKAGGPLARAHGHDLARRHGLDQSRRLGEPGRALRPRAAIPTCSASASCVSAQKWLRSPEGRHIELGIAENNLFLLLAALGLAEPLFGERLLPVGTVYDPFISRGLDALNYACYQDARFLLVATPSGLTLAPEGGAHQSVIAPLIGLGQPGLTMFEPSFVDELAVIMAWAFDHMQRPDGGSVYLRLSTRPLEQPRRRLDAGAGDRRRLLAAGAGAGSGDRRGRHRCRDARSDRGGGEAGRAPCPDRPAERDLGRPAARRLDRRCPAHSHIDRLLAPLARDAVLVSVIDGHPATLSWLGAVRGQRIAPLGVGELRPIGRHSRPLCRLRAGRAGASRQPPSGCRGR